MADNSIRVKRIEMNMTQSELASHMPDGVNAMCLSYVENGKLLPTRDGMNALCSLFHCSPTDLYRPEDLNLLGTVVPEPETSAEIRVRAKSDSGSRQHGDSVEFRVWLRPSEKDMLENAVNALGYVMEKRCRNDVVVSENDLKRYMQLGYTVICAYFDGHRYKNIHRIGGKYEFVYS